MNKRDPKLNGLADQEQRERFRFNLDRNFSVVAPAGAGKTHAIVDRIVSLAIRDQQRGTRDLARLVVVTYTNKAAEEMQQRARAALVEQRVDFSVLALFNRTFFGTIHSFCLQLLRQYAHLLGLPSRLDVLEPETALWPEFVRYAAGNPDLLSDEEARCLRFISMEDLFRLARGAQPWWEVPEAGNPPQLDLTPVLDFPETGRGRANIQRFKQIVQRWYDLWLNHPESHCGLPVVDAGGKNFELTASQALQPIKTWAARCSWRAAQRIAAAYHEYRLARGYLTYNDQVFLTHRLLREHPAVLREIRAQKPIILLDEAQDTDPLQFDILLEITRPEEAPFGWKEDSRLTPLPGSFCMVGDPQQSIYADRADLEYYQRVRQYLQNSADGEEVVFEVTFRCDAAITRLVNQVGPILLNGEDGQAQYVRLETRPDHGPGQVIRLILSPDAIAAETANHVADISLAEAEFLAHWLRQTGYEKLGARDWSEVGILCQQRRWLEPIANALEAAGLKAQIHSPSLLLADHPAYAWLTALLHILVLPQDTFNCVGVLREIFGFSDQELADFAQGDGNRFRIDRSPPPAAEQNQPAVAAALALLGRLRQQVLSLPLRESVGRVIEATRLAERALAVHPVATEVRQQLNTLLGYAVDAEARGLSLSEFAAELIARRGTSVEPIAVEPGAVQVLTCHKAKGLQWDCVILPLFFRPARPRQQPYPVLIQARASESPTLLMDKDDYRKVHARLRQHRVANTQRLLYVALTRARRSLVIIDDAAYFKQNAYGISFGQLLEEQGKKLIESLPQEPRPLPTAAAAREEMEKHVPLPRVTASVCKKAQEISARIRERILPSLLVHGSPEEEPELEQETAPELPGAAAARRYGNWWHEMMENMPWADGVARWKKHFAACCRVAPDRARARREWELFCRSELAQRLARPGIQIHTELPFLRPLDDSRCMEGFVDLVCYDPANGTMLIVDWKTNRIAEGDIDRLADLYRPQIQAYAESLRELVEIRGLECALYSTFLGQLIPL